MSDVERQKLDPKVQAIADAIAKSMGPIPAEQLGELGEALMGMEPARAEAAATHLVALGIKLFKADGESALEVIAQLYVLATIVLGEKGAAQAYERAVNYGRVTGEESRTSSMSVEKQKLEVKGTIKRGLR